MTERIRWADPPLLILASLASGPKHGYAITLDIEEVTGRRPGPGTLYGALARLEERGLVEALEGEPRRRPYRITQEGRTVFATALGEIRRFSAWADRATAGTAPLLASGACA